MGPYLCLLWVLVCGGAAGLGVARQNTTYLGRYAETHYGTEEVRYVTTYLVP